MNRGSISVTGSIIIINCVVFLVGLMTQKPALLGIYAPGESLTEPTLQILGAYAWFTCCTRPSGTCSLTCGHSTFSGRQWSTSWGLADFLPTT